MSKANELEECPKCGNHSLYSNRVYKILGLKYSHTEYECVIDRCGYSQGKTKDIIRNEKLNKLGI